MKRLKLIYLYPLCILLFPLMFLLGCLKFAGDFIFEKCSNFYYCSCNEVLKARGDNGTRIIFK